MKNLILQGLRLGQKVSKGFREWLKDKMGKCVNCAKSVMQIFVESAESAKSAKPIYATYATYASANFVGKASNESTEMYGVKSRITSTCLRLASVFTSTRIRLVSLICVLMLTIGVGQMWADHTKVSAGSMVSGEKYIITATYSSTTYYLVPGAIETSSNRGSYSTSLTEAAAWTFTSVQGGWTITTMVGDDLYYLYNASGSANSVASYSDGDDPLIYTITATSGGATTVYINGNSRYLALYTSGSNWRAYTETSQANSQPVIQLYKVSSNYTVTYNANGGSGNVPVDASSPYAPSSSVTVLGNVGTPAILTRTNCTFAGWNTNADGTSGTSYVAGNTFTISANTTLYAKWTATVTWVVNGVTVQTDNIVVPAAGKSVTPPSAPNPASYCGQKFMGWTTVDIGASGQATDAGLSLFTAAPTVTGSTTYYAVFADYAE